MAARIVSTAVGPRPRRDGLEGKRGRIRKNMPLLSYGVVLLVWALEYFSDTSVIHTGLRDTTLGNHPGNITQAGASTSFVVFASASPIRSKTPEKGKAQHQPDQSDQRHQEGGSTRVRAKSHEYSERRSQSASRPVMLRLDSKSSLPEHLSPYTTSFDVCPPNISSVSALRRAGSAPPSPGCLDELSSEKLCSQLHKGETLRPLGCDSLLRMNPFPLFSRMSSIGETSTCGAPIEADFGGNETEDEFGAASADDTAASGLCPKPHRTLSLRRAPGEPFESGSAGGMVPASTETWKNRFIRKFTVTASRDFARLVGRAQRAMRKKTEAKTRSSVLDDIVGSPPRHGATTGAQADVSTSPEDVSPVSTPSTGEAQTGETISFDEVDSSLRGRAPTAELQLSNSSDEECLEDEVEEDSLEALQNYRHTRQLFAEQAEKYAVAANVYYGNSVTPFKSHPSSCAKVNIAKLVDHVGSATSLLYAPSLRELMHLVVRVLFRGVQLVAVCYPQYSYNLGRNESTILKLPHFMRIFEESLKVVARDPGTLKTVRQEQLDMAFKAQSAASQAEAALGAMESVVASGLTTTRSELVDVLSVHDLIEELRVLPTHTKRLLLMLAELCRSAYEMSEPEAQSFLCQVDPAANAPGRELDPVVEESVAYCKVETTKFENVFNNAQATAKKVAEVALTLYNKLVLVDFESRNHGTPV